MIQAKKVPAEPDKSVVRPKKRPHSITQPDRLPPWTKTLPIQTSLKARTPGDKYEREADRVADKVVSSAPGQTLAPGSVSSLSHTGEARIQREEDDKSGEALSGGAAVTYKYLSKNPGYAAWQKEQTDRLKLKLWDSQPTEYKAGIIGFGLLNAGLLGSVIAADPETRSSTIDFLQGKNLLLPTKLVPYSEYFPVSSFKYKLPSAKDSPYTFETEFSFDPWFKLMRDEWGIPEIGLSAGVESSYGAGSGFSPVTGGNIKLKFGGGLINLSGFLNQTLPQAPMLLDAKTEGGSPVWLMRSIPGQPGMKIPPGSGVFLTLDIMRIPRLF